jgi:hypothetical protein
MKKLIVIILLLISLGSFSQSWNGVPISGSVPQLKANLANKGFTFIKKTENCYVFKGKVSGEINELYVFVTPKTQLVTKFSVYKPIKYSWYSLESEYDKIKDILTNKYGQPQSFEYFLDPYYLGDGYEYQAVGLDKCRYASFWTETAENTNISLSICEFYQVRILYENVKLLDKYNNEVSEKNSSIY